MNGVIVIKEPRYKEPPFADYDYDLACHVIAVDDAAQYNYDFQWPGFHLNASHLPQKEVSLVVNGRGSYNVRTYPVNYVL